MRCLIQNLTRCQKLDSNSYVLWRNSFNIWFNVEVFVLNVNLKLVFQVSTEWPFVSPTLKTTCCTEQKSKKMSVMDVVTLYWNDSCNTRQLPHLLERIALCRYLICTTAMDRNLWSIFTGRSKGFLKIYRCERKKSAF